MVAIALLLAGLAATALGADDARRPVDPQSVAEEVSQLAIERGNRDAEVRSMLIGLRRELSWRPLDSRTRVIYASLLLGLSRSLADVEAARFHARQAAHNAPVTVPVVHTAALILARCGDADHALQLVREMFGYDHGSAARLLIQMQPMVYDDQLAEALPHDAAAWHAWFQALSREGRSEEADRWLVEAYARWPEDLPILQNMAARALRSSDAGALARLFPVSLAIPDDPAAAALLTYRARFRATEGELTGARKDLQRALELDGNDVTVQILAGEAFEEIGDYDEARRLWSTALFTLAPNASDTRRAVLVRLARLEQGHGEPATALRLWRQVLETDPENEEARRRIRTLTGASF